MAESHSVTIEQAEPHPSPQRIANPSVPEPCRRGEHDFRDLMTADVRDEFSPNTAKEQRVHRVWIQICRDCELASRIRFGDKVYPASMELDCGEGRRPEYRGVALADIVAGRVQPIGTVPIPEAERIPVDASPVTMQGIQAR